MIFTYYYGGIPKNILFTSYHFSYNFQYFMPSLFCYKYPIIKIKLCVQKYVNVLYRYVHVLLYIKFSKDGIITFKRLLLNYCSQSKCFHINRYVQKDGIELQKMTLGLEIILHNIPKIILMMTVAIFLGILLQTAITWLTFASIRRYASGLHAQNSTTCTVASLLMFVAAPYVMQGVYLSVGKFILIFAVVVYGLYRYAPADTAACPILGAKRRAKLKKRAVLSGIAVMVLAIIIFDDVFYVLVATGAVYAVIAVLPTTYKILKRSMNNYEKYE